MDKKLEDATNTNAQHTYLSMHAKTAGITVLVSSRTRASPRPRQDINPAQGFLLNGGQDTNEMAIPVGLRQLQRKHLAVENT